MAVAAHMPEKRAEAHPKPEVNNATRVIVGFPFSTIKIRDELGADDVAELVAKLCRVLADGSPPEELKGIADDADQLVSRLRRQA